MNLRSSSTFSSDQTHEPAMEARRRALATFGWTIGWLLALDVAVSLLFAYPRDPQNMHPNPVALYFDYGRSIEISPSSGNQARPEGHCANYSGGLVSAANLLSSDRRAPGPFQSRSTECRMPFASPMHCTRYRLLTRCARSVPQEPAPTGLMAHSSGTKQVGKARLRCLRSCPLLFR